MNMGKDYDKITRKIYLAYHQDGMLDLVIGLCVTGFALFMVTNIFYFLMLSWLPFFLYLPLKKKITQPRFGYVQFTSEKISTIRLVFVIVIGVIVLFLFLGITAIIVSGNIPPDGRYWLQKYHMAVLGGLAGLVALGAAVFLGLQRFYIYALLAVFLPTLGAMVGQETFIPIMVLGGIIISTGLTLLLCFLRNYPLVQEDSTDAKK